MTLNFTPPPHVRSPLSRLDPRWKLAALVLAAVAVAVVRTPLAAGVGLAGAVVLGVAARLPLRWWLGRIGPVILFVALLAAPLPFLWHGEGTVWRWGPVSFAPAGLTAGLVLLAKAAAVVTLMLVLTVSAPLDATLKAAHALYVPGLLVQVTLLSYRYLFLLADELARVRVALRVRGYRNRANRHSYRTVGNVAGLLLVRGWERAERVGQAMRCRGFDGRFRSLTSFHTTAADVVVFGLVTAGAAGVCLLDWTL
jgi:cobalt/nickel transport system permease protein